jgi:hypothetical protein
MAKSVPVRSARYFGGRDKCCGYIPMVLLPQFSALIQGLSILAAYLSSPLLSWSFQQEKAAHGKTRGKVLARFSCVSSVARFDL